MTKVTSVSPTLHKNKAQNPLYKITDPMPQIYVFTTFGDNTYVLTSYIQLTI